MAKFKVGQRVVVNDKIPVANTYVKEGMAGVVTAVREMGRYGYSYEVRLDSDIVSTTIHESFLKLEEEPMKIVNVVEGPRGTTDSLSQNAVQSLVTAGILFHNRTNVFDDRLVKYYGTEELVYRVSDKRSNYKALEEQFPKEV